MSVVNVASLDAIAKDVRYFGPKVWQGFNTGSPLLDLIDSPNSPDGVPYRMKIEGRQIWIPVTTDGNVNAVVGFGETDGMADPGRAELDKLVFNLHGHSQSMQMSDLAMITHKGGDQSDVDALVFQFREQRKIARHKMNWLLHQDGSGELSQCGTTTDTNVIQLANPSDMAFLKIGTRVVIRNRSTGSLNTAGTTPQVAGTALEVTARSTTNYTITVTDENGAAVSITTSDQDGVYAFDSIGKTMNGLGIMCSNVDPTNWGNASATYGGVARASNTWHQAYVLSASDTTVSPTTTFSIDHHVRKIIHKLYERTGEQLKVLCPVRFDNWDNIGRELERDQRTAGGFRKKLTGGWDGIEYQNVTFVLDFHAPIKAARFFTPGRVFRYRARDWYWDDTTGEIWKQVLHKVSGRRTQVFAADMLCYQQAFTTTGVAFAQVTNLNASN